MAKCKFCDKGGKLKAGSKAESLLTDKLKELRKENEWTQKELADRLQITRASVASWETNRAEPSLTDLCRIAALFDESTDYLLGYDKGEERAKKKSEARFDSSKGKQVF